MRHGTVCLQGSSRQWMQRQSQDPFVAKARQEGYIARSAYKLLHMDDRFHLFDRQHTRIVVDLGCSPGGWCQVIRQRAGDRCFLLGVDMLPIKAQIPNAVIVQGDFTLPPVQQQLFRHLAEHSAHRSDHHQRGENEAAAYAAPFTSSSFTGVDVVTSDMCPNRMGGFQDRQRIAQLNMQAVHVCAPLLRPGGHFVCKVLGSRAAYTELWDHLHALFLTVHTCKPPASRVHSDEAFLVGVDKLALPRSRSCVKSAMTVGASGGAGGGQYGLDDWPGFGRRGRGRPQGRP
ncbi:putative mitochondrial ribosomal RNA methyltransferase-like protein [Leptomonas pyrrhocoris]|uniref:rRNA methyltransferase 2, mitochondrial n=1 Tax=Leptomonas pyrrhocoris TaxID=157538 RepID=A0A0N0DYG1_LEPPY|nr:putative mitochondrial ribosomal RNA methyltransferase-like protein [Leptomonas pyrrhocoris]XP_015662491.1 putative mitochondrial ribosomal RNA methyltransferase-like protein [Leptomonas pyrrhocoris]KPA84051.1 putative mitochondrial ribosomal RNA methyltransferase-like protein [Leptomonas pyrrhocoris]KPA84052.1 putative mitochondrial ribosomal RNA methyltransferase-like protein [Leptomonas pyrrhocoris]|eukprot:XP_015662490.1 putative mitochondrial ribosomal RNA methyltransferase-like protein [Leptomonas pyrrhocoris]